MTADNGGKRFNEGKPRFDLIPPEAMFALAVLFQRGGLKYEDRNWERGMDWTKCFASLQRHAWAWMNGEDYDPDPQTMAHHMIAVAWNAMVLATYEARKIGIDDRPKGLLIKDPEQAWKEWKARDESR